MKTVKNINYHNYKYMDFFLPDQEEFFVVIYFHGGGLVEGDKGDTHTFCEHLANHGFAAATANYSLMPEAHFPDYLNDAAEAVKYVINNISKYGNPKGFIVMGQSAGAYLTLMLCLNDKYLSSVGINNKDVCAWVSDAGQPTSHFNILKIEKGLSPLLQRIDETAPLYYVNEKTDFSRLLLLAYENDLPNRVEQNKLLLSSIKSFNKEADVSFQLLKGEHCHGSGALGEDGEYEVIKAFLNWFSK